MPATATKKRNAAKGKGSELRPTIHDFRPGGLYSVRQVAALFGRSKPIIHKWIMAKKLEASRIDDKDNWLIPGEAVRVLYGKLKLTEDAIASGPSKLPEDERRDAMAALKDLKKL